MTQQDHAIFKKNGLWWCGTEDVDATFCGDENKCSNGCCCNANLFIVLDDLRTRKVKPNSEWDAEYTHFRHSRDLIEFLESYDDFDVEELWLDFDLGIDERDSHEIDTGDRVVKWLMQRWQDANPVAVNRIFVHSMNSVGARRMYDNCALMYGAARVERVYPTSQEWDYADW